MRRWLAVAPAGVLLALACRCASQAPPDSPPPSVTAAATATSPAPAVAMDRRDSTGATIGAPPAPLERGETERAADLALRELTVRNLRAEGPLYFVDAELLRDKSAPERRLALVQHYRYAGAMTITTLVDLREGRVIDQRTERNVPTPLAPEEAEQARQIARADPNVQRLLERYPAMVIEPMLIQTRDREDPLFGRRVVDLLFRVGRDYVSGPRIRVDLNARRVTALAPSEPHAPHQ